MNVADAIAEQIAAWGVTHVFGVSGANIELVFDSVGAHDRLQAVLAKHEAAATMMAIGYQARSTRLGVVLATSGGGAFNIVAPLTEALASGTPLVALVGQTPLERDGTGAFQDSSGRQTPVHAQRIFETVTVSTTSVTDPAETLPALRAAAAAALDRSGPAVVLLPRDVQTGDAGREDAAPLAPRPPLGRPNLDPEVIRLLSAAVQQPAPPLLIAGPGVERAGARQVLARLATRWNSPVAVTPDAKSALASTHPLYLGVAGVMGHAAVAAYAAQASVCVLVGAPLPDVAAYGLDQALTATTIVNIGHEPCFPALRGHPDVHDIPGDLPAAISELCTRVAPPTTPIPRSCDERSSSARRARCVCRCGEKMSSAAAIELLADHLEPGADVFIDAGNAGAFAVHHLATDGGGQVSVALGMGAMGHAFGASIGAASHTRRRTYVIAGDGAFYMHGLEVHTAREYELPITYILLNNNAHAMCRLREERLLSGDTGTNVFAPAHPAAGIAHMLPGVLAREIDSLAELDAALSSSRAVSGPVFLSIDVPADEQPPFWPLSQTPQDHEVLT